MLRNRAMSGYFALNPMAIRRVVSSLACGILFLRSGVRSSGAEDFQAELVRASSTLASIQEGLEQQVHEGKLAQANQQLLATFPKDQRTPAETLAMANMLYGMDAQSSYALHKEVAQQLPGEPLAVLEWAMEQHRAGDYAGALECYNKYSKAHPQFAPVHGLAADCLIHAGKTREAVTRWQESEKAREGSLETLESLVCEVYRDPTLERRRADLFGKAQQGDVDAAVRLVALDGKYERDWWNNGPNRANLEQDLRLLQALATNLRIKAALCAGECMLKEDARAKDVEAILKRYGYLVDPQRTLPSDAIILSLMLGATVDVGVLNPSEARERFGDVLRDRARTSKDADLHNVVAYLYVNTESMAEIEKQAWEATDDPRFAAGYLTERLKHKSLTSDDPLLAKAIQQFPEDSWILLAAVAVSGSPSEDLVVRAIKAEYRHFSSGPGLILRPSARPLRAYFAALGRMLEKKEK
jgi:tetratricopeptide (TPR) repeat protein